MGKTSKTVQWKLDKMVELYQSGLSAKACAEQVGSSAKVCLKELKRRDIQTRGCSDHLKTPQDVLDKIIENYLSGMTMKESVKEFSCSWSVCQDELKKRKIKPRISGTYQSPSIENKDKMVQNYLNGMTAKEAGASIGVTFTTCLKELKRREISTREPTSYTKLPVNEDFFEKIDTEKKAYWLGFIAADGSIDEKRYQLHFSLQERDKEHLNKFLNDIESGREIKVSKRACGNTSARITLTNKKLITDLVRHGIHQKKSFTVKPYKFSDNELERAYWRGVVDGDGHILKEKSETSHKGYIYRVGLTGNEFMVKGFVDFLLRNDIPAHNKISNNGNIKVVKFGKEEVMFNIIHLLYLDASIYLDRKYQTYLEVVGEKIA